MAIFACQPLFSVFVVVVVRLFIHEMHITDTQTYITLHGGICEVDTILKFWLCDRLNVKYMRMDLVKNGMTNGFRSAGTAFRIKQKSCSMCPQTVFGFVGRDELILSKTCSLTHNVMHIFEYDVSMCAICGVLEERDFVFQCEFIE